MYYKAFLTTNTTKNGRNIDLLIFKASNPIEAMNYAIDYAKNRKPVKRKGDWFVEDLVTFK